MSLRRKRVVQWGTAAAAGACLAVVAYLSLAPAGAEGDRAPAPTSFDSAEHVTKELGAAVDRFEGELPPKFDEQLAAAKKNLSASDDSAEPAQFEEGFAESLVVEMWRCGWEADLVGASVSNDSERINEAAKQLNTFYDLAYAKKYFDDPTRSWKTDVLDPALKGELKNMADEVANCGVTP